MVVSTLITSTSVVTYRTSCTTPFSCNEYVDCCPYLVDLHLRTRGVLAASCSLPEKSTVSLMVLCSCFGMSQQSILNDCKRYED